MTDEARNIILENNNNPFHKEEKKDDKYIKTNANNMSCIDNIDLYVLIENNILKEMYFNGEACAISTSAVSLMIKTLIGKSINEVKEFIFLYEKMIQDGTTNEILKETNIYQHIKDIPSRKVCALLPYEALKRAISEYENNK